MLKVKSGVHPRSLTIAAAVINAAIELQLTADMLITSGNDGVHMPKSKHYEDAALDFRTKHLNGDDRAALIQAAKKRLGKGYDVILESLGRTNEHLHIEWDPKS